MTTKDPLTDDATGVRFVSASARAGRASRWITHAATIAVMAPLPYSLQRVCWAAGMPLGIERDLLDEFHAPGWGSLYILGLVALIEGTALWTQLFVRSRATVVPGWVPLAGGRPVKPWLVIAALLAPIAILAQFNLFTVTVLLGRNDFGPGVPEWSLALQATSFAIWGVTLTVATLAYARAMRGPTRLRGCRPMTVSPRRWTEWVTTIAVLAPLPYSLSRVTWALGIPLGIDEDLLRQYRCPGIGSLFILLLAALAEATALWTHAFLRCRNTHAPVWMPLIGRRPVGPKWVIAPLLIPILILAHGNAFHLSVLLGHDEFGAGVSDWALGLGVAVTAVWGMTLTIATLAYLHDLRRGR